ncbi:MAG: hypothetical protein LBV51_02760 [Acholeplasmatales bacterium]|jgi:hypothetical protein|nr:hypothetical protein [Acholeplasmatales bacterium]
MPYDGTITTKNKELAISINWFGGRGSVEALLTYCKIRRFAKPEENPYGWATLCQVACNYTDRKWGYDVGIDKYCQNITGQNRENGLFIIENYQIVGRKYYLGIDKEAYNLKELVLEFDNCQPSHQQLGKVMIENIFLAKNTNGVFYGVNFKSSFGPSFFISADNKLVSEHSDSCIYRKKFISEDEAKEFINKIDGTAMKFYGDREHLVSKDACRIVKYEDEIHLYFKEQDRLRTNHNLHCWVKERMAEDWDRNNLRPAELFVHANANIPGVRSAFEKQAFLINEITKYAKGDAGLSIYSQSALAEDETNPDAIQANRAVWEEMENGEVYQKVKATVEERLYNLQKSYSEGFRKPSKNEGQSR